MLQNNKTRLWIIIIIGFFVYLPTLFNGFVWDDEEQIVNNPQIRSISNLPAFFSGSTFNSGGGSNLSGLYYRPLMTSSFTFVYSIFGLNPFFFHLLQIILHITNACLLYLILFYIFDKFNLDFYGAFFSSILFLVHPISVEAVSYLSGYQEVLFFFFAALSFLLILKNSKFSKIFWATFLIIFSLFSKETGAVFSGVILLYLIFFEKEKLRPFLYSLLTVIFTYSFFRFEIAKVYFNKHGLTQISNMDLFHRLINIPEIIVTYLKSFIWPVNLVISQQWVVSSVNFWTGIFIITFFVMLFVVGLIMYKKRIKFFKLWIFFLMWFLAALSFHLQIFPLDLTVSDRWFYLALAGLSPLIFLTLKLTNLKGTTVIIFLLVILASRTVVREFDWRDGLTLYSHDIKISQNSFDLENNLGVELFRIGDFAGAKKHFQKSVELSPQWWTNWNNLGAIYEREGDLVRAQEYYRKSIDNGQYYLAYENYAKILYRKNKIEELKIFLEKEALIRLPNNQLLRQLQDMLYNQK